MDRVINIYHKDWNGECILLNNEVIIRKDKKDEKGNSNASTLMGQMIALEMMIVVAHKYPKHKSEFDKIFQEYLKHNKSSDLLQKTYTKEVEIKKQSK